MVCLLNRPLDFPRVEGLGFQLDIGCGRLNNSCVWSLLFLLSVVLVAAVLCVRCGHFFVRCVFARVFSRRSAIVKLLSSVVVQEYRKDYNNN